jgi:hypothetical protein
VFLEICLIPGGFIIHVIHSGLSLLVSNLAGRISANAEKKSVRTIGNFNGINFGCGDARKKFAYELYFGYDKTKLNFAAF